MKRLLTYVIGAAFLLALAQPAAAVEKKQSDKAKTTRVETSKKNKPAANAKPAKTDRRVQQSSSQNGGKKYDSFVDRNRNGIDDRKERNRPTKKQAPTKKVDPKMKTTEKSQKKD